MTDCTYLLQQRTREHWIQCITFAAETNERTHTAWQTDDTIFSPLASDGEGSKDITAKRQLVQERRSVSQSPLVTVGEWKQFDIRWSQSQGRLRPIIGVTFGRHVGETFTRRPKLRWRNVTNYRCTNDPYYTMIRPTMSQRSCATWVASATIVVACRKSCRSLYGKFIFQQDSALAHRARQFSGINIVTCSDAFKIWWFFNELIIANILRNVLSERIVKICQYLAKIRTRVYGGFVFLTHGVGIRCDNDGV